MMHFSSLYIEGAGKECVLPIFGPPCIYTCVVLLWLSYMNTGLPVGFLMIEQEGGLPGEWCWKQEF